MSLQHVDAVLSYSGLVALATSSVYAGALGSYKPPKQKKLNDSTLPDSETDSDDDDDELDERLSASEALLFPIIGSVVLGGFYIAFKYFGDDWINKLLGYYFFIMGIGCVWKCLTSITKQVTGRRWYRSTRRFRLKVTEGKPLLTLRLPTLLLFPVSLLPSISFFLASPKPALTTDIMALSFAHSALSMLKLDSLRTGCILLVGLFFYDVWWVFGTTVMVKVATTLDVPIKLLWPRSVLSFLSILPPTVGKSPNMLLGLGDVVIPGTLVALAYRLDMHMAEKRWKEATTKGESRSGASYFRATLVGYAVGLSMAFGAMHVFKAAQPALLYLSPTCCLSFIFTAIQRNELGYVWGWEDGAKEIEKAEERLKEKQEKERETKEEKAD